ncbi:MAG: alpha/beta family hydrolase [Cytophagales bacterium]|nr:alpha/beta family hydrolase [Cytophagales bacterium]
MTMFINEDIGSVNALIDESIDPKYLVILSHGAGAGMQHVFMESLAKGLASKNAHVMRFNFPYMDAGKKLPGSPKVSQQSILAALEDINKKYWDLPIFLAGKSYGGRMSSHVVADGSAPQVKGLIYYGFPLHAPGKDGTKRADHLQQVDIPQLFIQGTNDKLANFDLIKKVVKAQSQAELYSIDHADHSFRVAKKLQKPGHDIMKVLVNKTNDWVLSMIK